MSKSWVATLVARFQKGGYEAIAPRSKAPRTVPHRTSPELEDEIVALLKQLCELGVDAGAETIQHRLSTRREDVPSVSTIWRVLRPASLVSLARLLADEVDADPHARRFMGGARPSSSPFMNTRQPSIRARPRCSAR